MSYPNGAKLSNVGSTRGSGSRYALRRVVVFEWLRLPSCVDFEVADCGGD
jgi:hypothetical protein